MYTVQFMSLFSLFACRKKKIVMFFESLAKKLSLRMIKSQISANLMFYHHFTCNLTKHSTGRSVGWLVSERREKMVRTHTHILCVIKSCTYNGIPFSLFMNTCSDLMNKKKWSKKWKYGACMFAITHQISSPCNIKNKYK